MGMGNEDYVPVTEILFPTEADEAFGKVCDSLGLDPSKLGPQDFAKDIFRTADGKARWRYCLRRDLAR
ncbi:MAG: hypothetical protein AMXMBFR82_07280 [Candidatus Hydrogenedentota bacterium]